MYGQFPTTRLRRLRKEPWLRSMVAESTLTTEDLILPFFIVEGSNIEEPIDAMPGVQRYSIDRLLDKAQEAEALGIPAIALFPNVAFEKKSAKAKEAYNKRNLVCRAVEKLKAQTSNLGVITDVALDPYTLDGHDGVSNNGQVDNDATLPLLGKQALQQARAGADIIAPSDMMDGRIGVIRKLLDHHGFQNVIILSYAAKYASHFYGPFRNAIGSQMQETPIDKRGYQMSPQNVEEALREVALDIEEGADMVMIKPGMPYLDIVSKVSESFPIPVLAYQVSGEYAMLCHNNADYLPLMMESLMSFKRAGATAIFTYAAMEVATNLRSQKYA